MGLLFNNNSKKVKALRSMILSNSETLKFIVENKYNADDITNIYVHENEKKITYSFILKKMIEAKFSFNYNDDMSDIVVTATMDAATEDIANCLIYLYSSDNKIEVKSIMCKSIDKLRNSTQIKINATLPNGRYIEVKRTSENIIESKIKYNL